VIVLDASAAIEFLLATPRGARVEARLLSGSSFHAPHLIDVEVLQVLRRLVQLGEVSPRRALEALQDLADLNVTRYSHELFRDRIWALRASLTAYDAAYVALAEVLRAPLYTADQRLGRSHGHRVRIEVL
jgi:predicted nucleic acid-binding protein